MDVNERLRANTMIFLTVTGHTKRELSEHLGIRETALHRAFRRGDPHCLHHLPAIAEFFDVDPRLLLADPDRVWMDYPVTGQYLTPEPAGAVA